MDSLHLVDPELRPLLEIFPTSQLDPQVLAEARGRTLPIPDLGETSVTLEVVTAPGPPGAPDIALSVYRPRAATGRLPCIYHVHGGGYVLGAAKDMEALHMMMAAQLGCMIVSVDYRLAPETVFPGAIEDCYAGLDWLFAQADRLGVDASIVGVMGESAGGGLAAALALLARDRGEHRLAFQHLIYPMIDDRTCITPDPHPVAGEFLWHAHNNHFGWSALLGHAPGVEGVSPYAAAARAEDLSGLPPSFISVGGLDLFLEENLDYARRLMRAGVPVELHVYPGAFHGFGLAPDARVSQAARRDSLEALRRALNG
jgi:acetyl esterase/lipase